MLIKSGPGTSMLFLIITALPITISAQTCQELNCPICCKKKSDGSFECSGTSLQCQLKSSPNLNSFMTVLIACLAIFVGLPAIVILLEALVWWRVPGTGRSVCELIFLGVNKLCSCRKKTEETMEERRPKPRYGEGQEGLRIDVRDISDNKG